MMKECPPKRYIRLCHPREGSAFSLLVLVGATIGFMIGFKTLIRAGGEEGDDEDDAVRGEEDGDGPVNVFLYASPDEQETDFAFIGETSLHMALEFREDSSAFTVFVPATPLFEHVPFYDDYERDSPVLRGAHYSLHFNRSAPAGTYNITILVNITLENGTRENLTFHFDIAYLNAIEVTEVNVPEGYDREFSILVRTYVKFDRLSLTWDSDGDIDLDKGENLYHDLPPGNHTFRTKISQGRAIPGDRQEVGYHIIAYNGTRSIEIVEKNINVEVTWEMVLAMPCFQFSLGIALACFVVYLVRRRGKLP